MREYSPTLAALFQTKNGNGYQDGFKRSRLAELVSAKDPEQQENAFRQLAAVAPNEALQFKDYSEKTRTERLTSKAKLLKSVPPAQRANMWTSMLPDVRKDWAEAPDEYSADVDNVVNMYDDGGRQDNTPADVRSFEYFTQNLTPEEKQKAIRTKLNMERSGEWKTTIQNDIPVQTNGIGGVRYFDFNSKQWVDISEQQNNQVAPPPTETGAPNVDQVSLDSNTLNSFLREIGFESNIANEIADKYNTRALSKPTVPAGVTLPQTGGQPPKSGNPFVDNTSKRTPPSGYEYNDDGSLSPIKGGPADTTTKVNDPVKITAINSIRNSYQQQVKQPIEIMTAYEKMRAAAEDPSPAGDIALLYAYMKILDPTSVVRESEFATGQNAGSLPQQLMNQYQRVVNGERLSVNRADFLNQGAKLYISAKEEYTKSKIDYAGLAKRNGINTDDVLIDTHTPASKRYPAKNNKQTTQSNDPELDAIMAQYGHK